MSLAASKFTQLADKLLNPTSGTFAEFLGDGAFENAGAYDPVTDTTTPPEALSAKVVMLQYDLNQVDGQRIKVGDMQMIIQESLLGSFKIEPDKTRLTYTGPKSTDVATKVQIIAPTSYPVDSIVAFQARF